MAARRALEWRTSKLRLVFRYEISDLFPLMVKDQRIWTPSKLQVVRDHHLEGDHT